MKERFLVTGGAGFMGSHMIDFLLESYPEATVICVDKLSYASNYLMVNLSRAKNHPNFEFIHLDMSTDYQELEDLVMGISHSGAPDEPVTTVLNFASETCVDLSFEDPCFYTRNNIMATQNLLECCRMLLRKHPLHSDDFAFIHISTDEVYGEQNHLDSANEDSRLRPSNPYSATKAACDLIIHAYWQSFKMPIIILRPNNVYGPRQYPEKLVAVTLKALLHCKPNRELPKEYRIPIHGDGHYTRRYLHVSDLVRAVDMVRNKFRKAGHVKDWTGQIINIGTRDEIKNIDFVKEICDIYMKEKYGVEADLLKLVYFSKDRQFNDARYATDLSKINQLGWKPNIKLDAGIRDLVLMTINEGTGI